MKAGAFNSHEHLMAPPIIMEGGGGGHRVQMVSAC